jgi:hypothetical protein
VRRAHRGGALGGGVQTAAATCASTRCRGAAADAGAGGENVRDLRRDDRADRHITVTTDAGDIDVHVA